MVGRALAAINRAAAGVRAVRDGVVLVLRRGRRFLVGQRAAHKPAPGYWTPVSGKVEPGETQRQAVAREALEELGCRIEGRDMVHQGRSANGEYRLFYWRCDIVEGEPAICDDELVDLRWVTVEELAEMSPVFLEDIEVMRGRLAAEMADG